jgi:hypothetical protein
MSGLPTINKLMQIPMRIMQLRIALLQGIHGRTINCTRVNFFVTHPAFTSFCFKSLLSTPLRLGGRSSDRTRINTKYVQKHFINGTVWVAMEIISVVGMEKGVF